VGAALSADVEAPTEQSHCAHATAPQSTSSAAGTWRRSSRHTSWACSGNVRSATRVIFRPTSSGAWLQFEILSDAFVVDANVAVKSLAPEADNDAAPRVRSLPHEDAPACERYISCDTEGPAQHHRDRHSYDPEKRSALDFVGRRLEALLANEREAKVLTSEARR
jgi:hypothetical protein